MFSRKLMIYCLLWLYGVPAAVGPYWHSHHHCHPSNMGLGPGGDMHQGVACCDHGHHHVHSSLDGALFETDGVIGANQSLAADEHACAICAFYSQTAAPLNDSAIEIPLEVCWGLNQHASPLCLFACEIWQARAPPTA